MPKAKVKKVLDGDTVILEGGTRIRLAGVDAPELKRKGGAAAREELEALIGGKTISYTEEAKSYGRIVAKVKSGPKDINKEMAKKVKRLSKK